MKKTIVVIIMAAALASAETLTLVSAGPANDGAYYTGFYGLTVANPPAVPEPILGLCLSAAVEIGTGYSWQAELLSLPDYETAAGLTAQQGDELAYLWTQIAANPVPAMNDAVWTIAGVPEHGAGVATTDYWIGQAQANYLSINPAQFDVWTPENSAGVIDLTVSQGQMVDSPVPDPATFSLLGVGLLGLGAVWRRKQKQG